MTELKVFTNEFGTFTEGELVRYSVYPHGTNILGCAYEDGIRTTDAKFLIECAKQGMSTRCLWEHVHSVEKVSVD